MRKPTITAAGMDGDLSNSFNPQPKPEPVPKKAKKPLKRAKVKAKILKNGHTDNYYQYFGYAKGDFIPCEVCQVEAVDIHHIEPRSRFGSKMKGTEPGEQDHIENLIALCRKCHDKAHLSEGQEFKREALKIIHLAILL